MTNHAQPRPDWVVLGTPTGDGRVAVYASKDLNEAELRNKVDYPDLDVLLHRFGVLRRRIELTVEMRTYTIVVADTYAEAMRRLFDAWSPDADQPAINRRREIGAA